MPEPTCPACEHEWRRHDPEDGRCDAHSSEPGVFGPCRCGRDVEFTAAANARLSRQPPANDDSDRLLEAESHLWALLVWFGGRYDSPYVDRDVAAAARYVERHLATEDMTARHRDTMERFGGDRA